MAEFPTDVAQAQHGLVSTEQLRTAGFVPQRVYRSIEQGLLVRLSPRLLRVAGAPETPTQCLLAAVLDAGPGSAVSHTTALAWWGLPGFFVDEVHITHARDGVHRPRRLAHHVHEVVMLPEHHMRGARRRAGGCSGPRALRRRRAAWDPPQAGRARRRQRLGATSGVGPFAALNAR